MNEEEPPLKFDRRSLLGFGALAAICAVVAERSASHTKTLKRDLDALETVKITIDSGDNIRHSTEPNTYRIPTALAELNTREKLQDPAKVAGAFGKRLGSDDLKEISDDTVLGYYEHNDKMEPITVGTLNIESYVETLLDVINKGKYGTVIPASPKAAHAK